MGDSDETRQQSLGALTSALARALRLSHFTIESTPELVFWLSEGGTIARVNRAVVEALGGQGELGRSFGSLLAEGARATFESRLQEVERSGAPATFESVLTRTADTDLAVDVIVAPVVVDDTRHFCVFARDISERKQTERALATALAELQELKDRLEDENRDLKRELAAERIDHGIVGHSAALRQTLQRAQQVAVSDATVLILGESGTGKEVLARTIHRHSRRAEGALVKVNCAALPAALIESELFGHEKGAFTHAVARRIGRFEMADGGTLFLDEIGELPLTLQPKLLRVLQEGEFERVGGDRTLHVDVRVVAATNLQLEAEVAAGRFRADLYYRLSVVPIAAPALRERLEDIPLLARHFVELHSARAGKSAPQISPAMLSALSAHTWPGNVRELSNVIERAVILHQGGALDLDGSLPTSSSAAPKTSDALPTLREMEVALIRQALSRSGGVIAGRSGAARLLDMAPSTLRERMQRYGIKGAGRSLAGH